MEKIEMLFLTLYIIAIFAIVVSIYNDLYGKTKKDVNMPDVFFILEKGTEMPQKATFGASGYDFKAHSFRAIYRGNNEFSLEDSNHSKITLKPGERILISTGVKMQIPKGYELQIRSRSGLTLKQGLIVLNAPGTIDSDYIGDIGVILYNAGEVAQEIHKGERICQGVFAKVEEPKFQETFMFNQTERGSDGYGSTGRN